MNLDIAVGRGLQVVGKVCESWGRLTGNEMQRVKGCQLIVLGQMRVLGGRAAALLRYCTPRQALRAQTRTGRLTAH
jgi:uncharacterized protein YjbJ (UPF0337 family)